MKFLKTPLHLSQVEKLVGFSFLLVIVILNVVIVSAVQSTHGSATMQSEAAGKLINSTFGDAGSFAQTTDPCGFSNVDFQNNQNNNATPTGAAGGTGAGGNGTGGNGAGGNGTGGNGTGGNGTGGNGTGGNGTGGNGTGGNGTGGNGTGGNGTGGNGTGGNGTGGNGTGGNGTGGNGTGGNGTGGNGTGGNGTGGNGTGGNGTGGNGTGGNGTGGNGTGGNGTGGNGTGGNGTGGNGTGGNGTGGNGTGGNGTGGNGTGGNGTGGNGTGGNGTGGNGTGGNGTGGNGTGGNGNGGNGTGGNGNGTGGNGAGGNGTGGNGTGGTGTGTIQNANVVTCTDAVGLMNSNDILNYVLGDSNAGKNDRSANVNSNTMETGSRFATTSSEPLFLAALTAIYNDEFDAYADGLNYAQNPNTESVEQVANNLSYATTTVSNPESFVFGEVASCYKVGCWAGKNGHNGNYNDANMAKLLKTFGFNAIASENGVGQEDVNTYGAVVQALNEATPAVQIEMLNDIYTANAGNGTTTNDIVEDLHDYKEALAFVLSDSLATEEQDYATGNEIKTVPTFNIQIAQQGYNFNCVGSAACPTVAPTAGTGNTVGAIGNNTGAGGNGTGGNGTGGNGTGGNGTGGNGTGGNGTGGNGTGGNGTGGNGTGGNGTGGNGTGGMVQAVMVLAAMALVTAAAVVYQTFLISLSQ